MPTVSIILPTYNRAHLLSRSIQSVLSQSYQDFELIIVDDGSTDGTERLIHSFNDRRIIYIRHARNRGVAAARNTGIKEAKGRYIAFQDSDDEWMPGKLEKQTKALESAAPEVGVVYTGYNTIIKNEKRYMPSARVTRKEGCIYKSLLKGCFMTSQALLVKRECFETVGMFDERFRAMEDWELFLRISKHYQFKCVSLPLVTVYRQQDSISANQSALMKAFQLILEIFFEDISVKRTLLAKYYLRLGDFLCTNGELSRGRSYFVRSFWKYPLDIRASSALLISFLGQGVYKIIAEKYRKIFKPF